MNQISAKAQAGRRAAKIYFGAPFGFFFFFFFPFLYSSDCFFLDREEGVEDPEEKDFVLY